MSTINSGELKALVFEIIKFEDSPIGMLDKDGKPVKVARDTIHRDFYRGRNEIEESIRDTVEIAVVSKTVSENQPIEWVLGKGYVVPEDKKKIGERFSDIEIELSGPAVAALKHFNKDRKRLPPGFSNKALSDLDSLINS